MSLFSNKEQKDKLKSFPVDTSKKQVTATLYLHKLSINYNAAITEPFYAKVTYQTNPKTLYAENAINTEIKARSWYELLDKVNDFFEEES